MKLALMPVPNDRECDDFLKLGPMFDQLRPDQEVRVHQIMSSWGFQKHGLPVSKVKLAIRKVLQNWP